MKIKRLILTCLLSVLLLLSSASLCFATPTDSTLSSIGYNTTAPLTTDAQTFYDNHKNDNFILGYAYEDTTYYYVDLICLSDNPETLYWYFYDHTTDTYDRWSIGFSGANSTLYDHRYAYNVNKSTLNVTVTQNDTTGSMTGIPIWKPDETTLYHTNFGWKYKHYDPESTSTFFTDWGGGDYIPDTLTKTIYFGQQLNFKYDNDDKDEWLSAFDTNDGACVQIAYQTDGVQDTNAGEVLWDTWYDRLDINDLTTFDDLGTDEWLIIRPQITGTDQATEQVTVSFDTNKVNWYISNVATGTITDDGNTDGDEDPSVIDADNPFIPGDQSVFPEDDDIARSQYPEGLEGTMMYYMDHIFKFLSLPFTLLSQFFGYTASLITQAIGSVSALVTALQSVYGVLPATLGFLFTFAVSITIYKMIFGR